MCVLGVPNLSWPELHNKNNRGHVAQISAPPAECITAVRQAGIPALTAPQPDNGCLFYAARAHGAFSRRLSDPWAGAVHMAARVSHIDDIQRAVFCESAEVSHGSHSLTSKLAQDLSKKKAQVTMLRRVI